MNIPPIPGFQWGELQWWEAIGGGQDAKVFHHLIMISLSECEVFRKFVIIIIIIKVVLTLFKHTITNRLYSKLRRKRGSSVNLPPSPTPRWADHHHNHYDGDGDVGDGDGDDGDGV